MLKDFKVLLPVAAALFVAAFAIHQAGAALNVPSKGLRVVDGYNFATAHNQMNNYATQTVVALGTNQATAAQILNPLVWVNTSSASTGLGLPQCSGTGSGAMVHVTNASGQTITVYGKNGTSDTINGTAGATGVTIANNAARLFVCPVNAKWGSQ